MDMRAFQDTLELERHTSDCMYVLARGPFCQAPNKYMHMKVEDTREQGPHRRHVKMTATRLACWMRWGPPLAANMHAMHKGDCTLCRRRGKACFRHLIWGTPSENTMDALRNKVEMKRKRSEESGRFVS
jgi:hypothetical protein